MVCVIIQRKVRKGRESEFFKALFHLRSQAMRHPGYVSAETLLGHDNPLLNVVISTWHSAEQWQAWFNSAEREAEQAKIEPLLSSRTTIFVLDFMEHE
ncbi:MAG: antibiotic biosynthesis monooxygenase [Dehalococcoidia bacterium]|nr:antibiotic biosynthesis monooxygenase [Dehalococcoidia bacterium]